MSDSLWYLALECVHDRDQISPRVSVRRCCIKRVMPVTFQRASSDYLAKWLFVGTFIRCVSYSDYFYFMSTCLASSFLLFFLALTSVLHSEISFANLYYSLVKSTDVGQHIQLTLYSITEENRQAAPLFSLCFHLPWVVLQPILARASRYLRGSLEVVMEGWLRAVTSCSFTPGTLSGKVMAEPARCSSHF